MPFPHMGTGGPARAPPNGVEPSHRVILQVKGRPMAKAGSTGVAAKVETVSLRQLAVQLAEKNDLSKKQANQIMDDFVLLVTKHLKTGIRVRLNGLGILQVRKRAARMGRNPAPGETIKIKASKKVAFRAAKGRKEAVEKFGRHSLRTSVS